LAAPFGWHAIARRDLNADDGWNHALREVSKIRQTTLRNGGTASAKGSRQEKRGATRKQGQRKWHNGE
jgi:hypothetical protein